MAALDAIILPTLAPDDLAGLQLHLLEAVVTRQTPPVLLIHGAAGRWISIGRYHLYAGPPTRGGVGAYRRLTGGRAVGAGAGWLGVALILPTRSSLIAEEARGLRPEQVMNRYARGLMAGLRAIGLECFYPGRDAITFEQREIAMCSFDTDSSGAMLFEAALAVTRGMEEFVHDLEHLDPEGSVPTQMYDSGSATTVARELGRDVSADELSRAIAAGYEKSLGEIRMRDLTASEIAQAARRAESLAAARWLGHLAATFTLSNRMSGQLGSIEARIALDAGGAIERLTLTGDFIANSPAIAELERELRGKRPGLAAVSQAVTRTFAGGKNFFLGAGALTNLVRLIAEAN